MHDTKHHITTRSQLIPNQTRSKQISDPPHRISRNYITRIQAIPAHFISQCQPITRQTTKYHNSNSCQRIPCHIIPHHILTQLINSRTQFTSSHIITILSVAQRIPSPLECNTYQPITLLEAGPKQPKPSLELSSHRPNTLNYTSRLHDTTNPCTTHRFTSQSQVIP